MVKILFVCLGNICRSPLAEAILQKQIESRNLQNHLLCDSAGTSGYHLGELPDPRTRSQASRQELTLTHLARQVKAADFQRFDYILAMDFSNLQNLKNIQPPGSTAQLHLLSDFDPEPPEQEIPDPYYGEAADFERVYTLLEHSCGKLLDFLAKAHNL
jgi:protein-tyrosine phosphatase